VSSFFLDSRRRLCRHSAASVNAVIPAGGSMQTRWTCRFCWTYARISKNQATSLRNFVPVFAGLLRKFAAARRSSQALSTLYDHRQFNHSECQHSCPVVVRSALGPGRGRGTAPKSWLGPKFSRTLDTLWPIYSQRCQILGLKCTKFDFRWGSAPDPTGGAYSTPPDSLAVFNGPTSKERAGKDGRKGKSRGK